MNRAVDAGVPGDLAAGLGAGFAGIASLAAGLAGHAGLAAGLAGVAGLAAGLAGGLAAARVRGSGGRPGVDGGGSAAPAADGIGRPTAGADPQTRLAKLDRKSLDSLRVGVVVLDGSDEPVLANVAARAMGLLRAGPAPGTVAAHPIIRTLAGQVRRTGVRREVELDLPQAREGVPAEPLGLHLRAAGLGGEYVCVEAADVTESHRVARVRRDFVANVSHELKTPIGALRLLAEALLDAADDVAAAQRFAERIATESTRLGRLVTELLELSRLQGAEPLPEPVPVAVDWVISEALDRTRTAATLKRVEVRVGGQRGLTVYGSDGQFATAVANLVDNAIAYSAEDTTVRVEAHGDARTVEILVADEGIGIAPADQDRIFERFYRTDQARSRATGGTGLGLSIVKHVATNHGGRVDVRSAVGKGSTFTLRLPAQPPDAALPLPVPIEIEPDISGARRA